MILITQKKFITYIIFVTKVLSEWKTRVFNLIQILYLYLPIKYRTISYNKEKIQQDEIETMDYKKKTERHSFGQLRKNICFFDKTVVFFYYCLKMITRNMYKKIKGHNITFWIDPFNKITTATQLFFNCFIYNLIFKQQ